MRFVPATRRAWRCGALASCISALAGIAPNVQAASSLSGSEIEFATSTSYPDSGLSAKTSYAYAVTAVNPAGESAQSSAATTRPAPSRPRALKRRARLPPGQVADPSLDP